ncbi:MAG: prepilin-type N-terminal cleavage/methylation domain-containing protein [Spirochaetes bacterium]|nr:prepilin-type N-terminal cleavage/methylation domain-containing protein [Spirochaetota bacterium]
MIRYYKKFFSSNNGFTLIELLIVISILSIMSLIVAPRMSNIFDSKRSNFLILTSIIAKTFDDSFVNDRLNFVLLHLFEPMDFNKTEEKIFSRQNGVSVVVRNENGNYEDNKNKLLQYKQFSDSFKIEAILLSTGEKITMGNVLIPFYPAGQSDNVILHISVNNEENWSLRIYKMRKEPEIFPGYIDFSEQENEI